MFDGWRDGEIREVSWRQGRTVFEEGQVAARSPFNILLFCNPGRVECWANQCEPDQGTRTGGMSGMGSDSGAGPCSFGCLANARLCSVGHTRVGATGRGMVSPGTHAHHDQPSGHLQCERQMGAGQTRAVVGERIVKGQTHPDSGRRRNEGEVDRR